MRADMADVLLVLVALGATTLRFAMEPALASDPGQSPADAVRAVAASMLVPVLLGALIYLVRTSSSPAARASGGVQWLVLPGSTLVLVALALDVVVRGPARPETVAALALLGLLVVGRTGQLAAGAGSREEERRQLAYTDALMDVTRALADANDLNATLQVISDSACAVLGARGAGIELVLDDGATMEVAAAVGLPSEMLGLRFPVEGSFTGWVVRHGEPRAATDPSADPHIQPESLRFLGRSPVAAAPIRFRGQTTGALFASHRHSPFGADELAVLAALAEQAAIAIDRARLFDEISELSATDPLTAVPNRRSLAVCLEREFAAARRGRPLVAVIFDLDDFKSYNDRYGHIAGDEALQAFARSLDQDTRAMNVAARYGGDEFVALLSDTDLAGAAVFVERIRIRFAAAARALGRDEIRVSAGMAAYHPAMSGPEALLRAADNALYRQKPRARV